MIKVKKIKDESACQKRGCVKIVRDKQTIIEIHKIGPRYGWSWNGIYLPTVLQGLFGSRREAIQTLLAALV